VLHYPGNDAPALVAFGVDPANAKAPVTFHIQVTNRAQQPAQYWIVQTGPGTGGLTPVSPLSPAFQTEPQPSSAAQRSTQQKARAAAQAQTPVSGGAGLPPLVLPVTGGPEPASRFGIGLPAE
jgi:hypothetical protein